MTPKRILLGFVAGFLATLTFHQGGLALLHASGLTDRAAYGMTATKPLGVPAVISLAFWGGVWGIALATFLSRVARGYYVRAFSFGAALPTLVALFVVAPMKGMPMAAGGDAKIIVGALILNGLWGLGTALLLRLFDRSQAPLSH